MDILFGFLLFFSACVNFWFMHNYRLLKKYNKVISEDYHTLIFANLELNKKIKELQK